MEIKTELVRSGEMMNYLISVGSAPPSDQHLFVALPVKEGEGKEGGSKAEGSQ